MVSQVWIRKKDNYEKRRKVTDEQLVALWAASGGGSAEPSITGTVATYDNLPLATGASGAIYIVTSTTGIFGFRKHGGLYRSNGTDWVYLGNPVAAAADILNVPAATIAATTVQGAINELEGDIQGHIGQGGIQHAEVTTITAGFMSASDKTKLNGVATGATANATDANLRDRTTHTGQQASTTISDFNTAVDTRANSIMSAHTALADPHPGYLTPAEGNGLYQVIGSYQPLAAVLTGTTASFTTTLETKLNGIQASATQNDTDVNLRARSSHTGTQAASTISDFTEASQDVTGAMVAAAGGTYDDTAGTITLPGGGGGTTVLTGVATITMTDFKGTLEHTETVAATGVTASKKIYLTLAGGDDTAENSADMLDLLGVSAIPGTGVITINASFAEPTSGPILFNWSAI